MIPTVVSERAKVGAGTELQMNYGTPESPEWRLLKGVASSGDWGYDQDFQDDTDISEIDHTYVPGDAKAKEILVTMKHMPGDTDQKAFLDKSNANEEVQLRKVYTTGFTQTGTFLLSKPYYSDPTRSDFGKVSVKATPQLGLTDGTIV
ncbi:hypothetical protein [Marinomonas spartinae]|uniref:hypothetical protein n=1 Tax=Marinomonas spartinae TaxID=1792290 RepID=UPI0018F234B8|nr:hypothetical protein [Marinomonas spartinae]MBJ7555388.1 hypothetical protein [Marinomonas spartinae]